MPSVPLVPVPGVAKFLVHYNCSGVQYVNVFHVRCGDNTVVEQSNLNALTTGLRNAFKTTLLAQLSHDGNLSNVDSVDLSNDLGAQGSATGTDPGGIFTAATVASISCCVSWKAPRHYKGGHPRTYLGMIPSSMIGDLRSFTSAYCTAVTSAANAFRTAIAAISITGSGTPALVALHRVRHKVPLTTVLVDDITGAAVDTRIDTQRRRLGPDR